MKYDAMAVMKYIVHGSKNQNDSSKISKNEYIHFDQLLRALVTHWLSAT